MDRINKKFNWIRDRQRRSLWIALGGVMICIIIGFAIPGWAGFWVQIVGEIGFVGWFMWYVRTPRLEKVWEKNNPIPVHDLGDNPLDPRGDGTLQPGDPLYELMMRNPGNPMIFNRRDDGLWEAK